MLSEQDIIYIKENFDKLTTKQIYQNIKSKYSYTHFTVLCRKLNLYSKRYDINISYKNSHDYNYFSNQTLEAANIAGVIATDGCLFFDKRHESYTFHYSIAAKDESLMNFIKNELKFTGRVSRFSRLRFTKPSDFIKITIGSFNRNADYLNKYYNIVNNKTFRLGPINLQNKYLQLAFIIGAIAGDGYIAWARHKKNPYPLIGICGCSYDFIKWVENVFNNEFPFEYKKNVKRGGAEVLSMPSSKSKCYRYTVNGLRAAIIIDYLRQFPVYKLARKFDNPQILNYIQEKKTQFPHLFKILDSSEIQHLLPKTESLIPPENTVNTTNTINNIENKNNLELLEKPASITI